MPSAGYAFNRTRHSYLATHLRVAETHWSRFCGLMGEPPGRFPAGDGLWIVPCRGVHTFAMRFPIDVVYLDRNQAVVHIEHHLKPWRLAPVRISANSVLELPANTLRPTGTTLGDHIDIAVENGDRA